MILQTLILNNFRQFRGLQRIDFATERNRNVTVLFGENGRGKTGIFRAIMFCLYGEQRLSQDEDVSQKELFLVNSTEIEEAEGRPVEASVELKFLHKDEQYALKRSLLGMLDGNQQLEQLEDALLTHIEESGNTHNYTDPDDIRRVVNAILDKNIREYFLFDGERIQRLTLASNEQRREIAKGIRNLLNVDSLEKAIKAMQRLKKDLNSEISRSATGEFGQVIKRLNDLDDKLNELKNRLAEVEHELVLCESEKKSTDKELEKYQEIIHLLKDRQIAEENLKQQEEQAKSLLIEMKSRTGKASHLLISDTVDYIFNAIDEKKEKGEIPSEIRKDLIERILTDKLCICGRQVMPGSEEFKQIMSWKNRVSDTEIERSAFDIWRSLSSIRSHRDDTATTVEILLQKYAICKNEIQQTKTKIESLNSQIGSSERQDAADLERHREAIEKKWLKYEAERIYLDDEIKNIEKEYAEYIEKRKQLEKEQAIKSELAGRASLVEETWAALSNIYDEFTKEIRRKVADASNQYFMELLDKEGRETLRRILVNDDYSLQILDRWNKPFLANISAGQRQIMSISFIAALAKVAAAEKILEMPLFMDTPFGRLSFEHSKNLVEKIPHYCAQWVLLVTDREFRKQEATILRSGGQWGKFYQLKSGGLGITNICERNIDEAHLILSENPEA